MAVNPDPSIKVRHVIVIGATGSGKSQAIKNLLPRRGARVVAFDPDQDHDVHHFPTRAAWAKALMAADRSGKAYRIGWEGASMAAHFEQFCAAVWDVLDGRKETHIVLEEASQFCKSAGPALEGLGNLLRRGRKYNAVCYTVGQRASELPTTARTQSPVKYVGRCDPDDRAAGAKLVGVTVADIEKLENLPTVNGHLPPAFWKKEPGKAAELVVFKYIP